MNQEDIYNFLVANGPSTAAEIAEAFTGSPTKGRTNVQNKLYQLEKWDKVSVVDSVKANPGNTAKVWGAVCP